MQYKNGLINIFVNNNKKIEKQTCNTYKYKAKCLDNHCNYNDETNKCSDSDNLFNMNDDEIYDIDNINFNGVGLELGNILFYNTIKSINQLVQNSYLENDTLCIKHLNNEQRCNNDPKCFYDLDFNRCYSKERSIEQIKPYYFYNKCSNFKLEEETDFKKNSTLIDCIQKCKKSGCDIVQCQAMCLDCSPFNKEENKWSADEKKRVCPWYADIKIMDPEKPDPPQIRGFPGDREITIEWRKPLNNGIPITHYIIELTETNNKNSSKLVNMINTKDNNNDILSYICKNLINSKHYDIIVKSVNNIGMSIPSNTLIIMPIGESENYTIDNVISQLDVDQEDFFKSEYNCKDSKNIENHRLDNIGINDIDIKHQLSEYLDV